MTRLGSAPTNQAESTDVSRAYVVIGASPVRWSLVATEVLEIVPPTAWHGPSLDLDVVFENKAPCQSPAGRVLVVQASHGILALCTEHRIYLESFQASTTLPLPNLIFDAACGRAAAKSLILVKRASPLIVLDVNTLPELANALNEGHRPPLTVGEPAL